MCLGQSYGKATLNALKLFVSVEADEVGGAVAALVVDVPANVERFHGFVLLGQADFDAHIFDLAPCLRERDVALNASAADRCEKAFVAA